MKTTKPMRWKYRKRVIGLALVYCVGMVVYLTLFGLGESRLQSDVAGSLILLASSIIGGYVFGSIADDDPEDGIYQDTEFGTWEERRRVIFLTLLICSVGVTYITLKGEDNTLNSTIANGLCLMAGSVILSYVFGAVWSDKKLMTRTGNKKTSGW